MYYFNEGSLDLPAEWQDKTVNVLAAAKDDANGFSFTISRDAIPWGMTFDEFAEREIGSISRQLKSYRPLGQEKNELAGLSAVSHEFSWESPQGKIHQYMTLVDAKPHVLIFTGTMVGLLSEQQKEKVKAILQTLRINAHDEKPDQ